MMGGDSMKLTIDGVRYDVKCDVRRAADMTASEISGLMMDRTYFNDVIGTFLTYSLTFTYPLWDQNKYAEIFEVLSQPVDGHSFLLPYNQDTIAITARVEQVSDEEVEMESGRRYWHQTTFNIIANHTSKAMSLGKAIARGRAPLPTAAEPAIGESYTYSGSGWVPSVQYEDADDMYY